MAVGLHQELLDDVLLTLARLSVQAHPLPTLAPLHFNQSLHGGKPFIDHS
jgi:hypothetical protein